MTLAKLSGEIVCGLLAGIVIWLAVLFIVLIAEALRNAGKIDDENEQA